MRIATASTSTYQSTQSPGPTWLCCSWECWVQWFQVKWVNSGRMTKLVPSCQMRRVQCAPQHWMNMYMHTVLSFMAMTRGSLLGFKQSATGDSDPISGWQLKHHACQSLCGDRGLRRGRWGIWATLNGCQATVCALIG